MKKYYKDLSWSTYDLPKVFKQRGVHDAKKLPGFYYRDDALRLWQAINDFVTHILAIYYHSDKDIRNVSYVPFGYFSRSYAQIVTIYFVFSSNFPHSNETCSAILLHGAIYVVCSSNF